MKLESKTQFIKEQLALKGIYDYTEQQFKQLKAIFTDILSRYKIDKYTAFDRAFEVVFERKRNVSA